MKKLTARQQRFVVEFLKDGNATQAAVRAGFSKKTAGQIGSRLLKDVHVSAQIEAGKDEVRSKVVEKVAVDRAWVLDRLVENVERAMQAVPVMERRDGILVESGEYQYEGNVANRALELIGKDIGLFAERVLVDWSKVQPADLEAIAAGRIPPHLKIA